jgi:hypothetical protein
MTVEAKKNLREKSSSTAAPSASMALDAITVKNVVRPVGSGVAPKF